MRSNPAMLYPLFALAAWTLIVLVLIPVARVRSVRLREIGTDDFKYGESARVPSHVSVPNRNYMNLLELPMLFYVVGILLYVTGGASYVASAVVSDATWFRTNITIRIDLMLARPAV